MSYVFEDSSSGPVDLTNSELSHKHKQISHLEGSTVLIIGILVQLLQVSLNANSARPLVIKVVGDNIGIGDHWEGGWINDLPVNKFLNLTFSHRKQILKTEMQKHETNNHKIITQNFYVETQMRKTMVGFEPKILFHYG